MNYFLKTTKHERPKKMMLYYKILHNYYYTLSCKQNNSTISLKTIFFLRNLIFALWTVFRFLGSHLLKWTFFKNSWNTREFESDIFRLIRLHLKSTYLWLWFFYKYVYYLLPRFHIYLMLFNIYWQYILESNYIFVITNKVYEK